MLCSICAGFFYWSCRVNRYTFSTRIPVAKGENIFSNKIYGMSINKNMVEEK